MAAAVRNIVKLGDPILREHAEEVKRFNTNLQQLLDDMAKTMREDDGCGLAAPQVGISKRIIIVDAGEGVREFINPVILEASGSEIKEEGCLSVPDRTGFVERATKLKVQAQDRNGELFACEAEGMFARIIQHEIDHLNGRLFIDILVTRDEK